MLIRSLRAQPGGLATAIALGMCLAVGGGPHPAWAAEWIVSPAIYQQLFYDTNPGFTSDDENPSFGSSTNAQVALRGRSQTIDLRLLGRYEFRRFFQAPDLDTDNQYLVLNALRRGKRLDLALEGRFTRDVTRDDIIDTTGSRDFNNERQQRIELAPSATYVLTPTQRLTLSGSYVRRTYPQLEGAGDDGLRDGTVVFADPLPVGGGTVLLQGEDVLDQRPTRLQNYSQYGLSLAWLTLVNPRLTVGLVPSVLYLDQSRQNVWQGSLQGALEYQLTRRMSLNLRAGPSLIYSDVRTQEADVQSELGLLGGVPVVVQEVDFSKGSDTDLELGYVVDGTFNWLVTPSTTAGLRYTHSVEPSGTGRPGHPRSSVARAQPRTHPTNAIVRLRQRPNPGTGFVGLGFERPYVRTVRTRDRMETL